MKALKLVFTIAGVALPLLFAGGPSSFAATSTLTPFQNLAFQSLGPAVAGGRVTSVVGIPGNPKVYYIGSAGGGVWKSTDGGFVWKPIFNKGPTSSISNVVLDPSNPSIVWVATGEANPRNDVLPGAGLYRSTDGGNTWQLMGFRDAGSISKVVVDPHNSDVVWVAVLGHVWGSNAKRGVFKSIDGGKNWKKVLFVNDGTGAIDLRMDGGNSQVLFAAMWQMQRKPWKLVGGGPDSGLWRSIDGGDTWAKLSKGIPKAPLGRISVAPSPSNPERVYALIQSTASAISVYASNNMGTSWQKVSDDRKVDSRGMYYSQLYVSPVDENKLYSMSLNVMGSDDGGHTWRQLTYAPLDTGKPFSLVYSVRENATVAHGDQHALWQDPENPDRMILGNDGGVYISSTGGAHWRFADTLSIEQVYKIGVDSREPYTLCVGLQDNSGWCRAHDLDDGFPVVGPTPWKAVVAGDGQYIVPAPGNPNIVYADSQNGNFIRYDLKNHTMLTNKVTHVLPTQRNSKRKYRFNWSSPLAVLPSDANTVFIGGNVVFKSTDGGDHWRVISQDLTRDDKTKQIPVKRPPKFIGEREIHDTLLSLVLAPTDPSVMWAGSDDGLVHVTRDGGKHWANVTPPGSPHWGRVYEIGVSPFSASTAYLAFDNHENDDLKPYVYVTDNYGKSWHSIENGLPDEPVLVVREDPNQKGFLVLGNMTGLWFSRDNGAHWAKFHSGLPTAPVFDVKFIRHDLAVGTHGRGLYLMRDLRPFEEMNGEIAKQNFHLFTPSAGIEYMAESGHAPRPVAIDYYLGHALKPTSSEKAHGRTPVKIIVTDSAGHVVATKYGPAKEGINRYEWSMRYPGPLKLTSSHSAGLSSELFGSQDPFVLPGSYKVSVVADGKAHSATIKVSGDPNLRIPMDVRRANLMFALKARNNTSAFNQMLNRISDMQKVLARVEHDYGSDAARQPSAKELMGDAKSLDEKLTSFKKTVSAGKGGFSFASGPLLQNDLGRIGTTGGFGGRSATVKPTAQVLASAKEAWNELDGKLAKFNALLSGDVANYNKAAHSIGAPTLRTGDPINVKPVANVVLGG